MQFIWGSPFIPPPSITTLINEEKLRLKRLSTIQWVKESIPRQLLIDYRLGKSFIYDLCKTPSDREKLHILIDAIALPNTLSQTKPNYRCIIARRWFEDIQGPERLFTQVFIDHAQSHWDIYIATWALWYFHSKILSYTFSYPIALTETRCPFIPETTRCQVTLFYQIIAYHRYHISTGNVHLH